MASEPGRNATMPMNETPELPGDLEQAVGTPLPDRRASRWEWLPPLGLLAMALLYLFAKSGSNASRFALFVGVGLVPGCLWRLAGRKPWNVHRICFAAALVGFVLNNPDLRPDAASWTKIRENWHLVALGFVISFTQPLWGMLRTHRLLLDGGVLITRFNSLKLCLSGSFFNIFLPGSTGGDAYRVYAITDGYTKRLAPAIASITLDRLLGLPSLILVILVGLVLDYDFFSRNRVMAKLVPFLIAVGAACLVMVAYLLFAGKSGRRIASMEADGGAPEHDRPPGRLKRMHLRISANIKRPATLPLALFYGLMSHIACIAACQCFGEALGVRGVPMRRYYLIVPLVMSINAIPGAPGGVGQGELAMATFLDLAAPGMGNAQSGVVVMLLFRVTNMLMGLLGGVFYAVGKTDLVGLSHVSQGVTRILHHRVPDTVEMVERESVPLRRLTGGRLARIAEYFKRGGSGEEKFD